MIANQAVHTDAPAAPAVVNGVDVDTLIGTVNGNASDAGLGACRFRASDG